MINNKGFTLIELLIVVAIIAILAAIAIPNFLAAQVRAKVSRTKAEMRTLATALESYYVDNNQYVPSYRGGTFYSVNSKRIEPLSTPISYISSIPKPDPFGNPQFDPIDYDTYDYIDEDSFITLRGSPTAALTQWGGATWGRAWRICGSGPDRIESYAYNILNANYPSPGWPAYYDPSNGTVSNGDIVRFGSTGKLGYGASIVGPIQDN